MLTQIVTARGIPMRVRLVLKGEAYGLKLCLTHSEDDPLVEFYDDRHHHDGLHENAFGHFISRYYRSTLLGECKWSRGRDLAHSGLDLQGGQPEYVVDAAAMAQVLEWLKNAQVKA